MASVSPKSVIQRFAELLHLQILYMESAGKHEAILPNFLQSNCLQKNLSSEIEYDLGSESQFQNFEELPTLVQGETVARKRHKRIASTPQKGLRRK